MTNSLRLPESLPCSRAVRLHGLAALWMAVSVCSTALAQPAADTTVRFAEGGQLIEGGIDAGARTAAVKSLSQALERRLDLLAPQCLAVGQVLEIVLTEVNTAGYVGMRRGGDSRGEVRVARNSWSSSLQFDFTLGTSDTSVVDRGRERLTASGFLGSHPSDRVSTAPYPKEEALITDWFRQRYCKPADAPARQPSAK